MRRRSETFVAPMDDAMAAAPAESGGDAADRASDRSVVTGALGRLPVPQREVLELAYYGGLTQTENAGRVKQPLGTQKKRMRLGVGTRPGRMERVAAGCTGGSTVRTRATRSLCSRT